MVSNEHYEDDEPLALTPAETTFVDSLEDGLSLTESAYKAFPEAKDPMRIAKAKLDDHDYIRTRLMVYFENTSMRDQDLVNYLKQTMDLALTNPKSSTALLNATKFAFEVKNLMPKKQTNLPHLQDSGSFTQNQIITNYYTTAQEKIPQKEIDTLLKPDIIKVQTIPKKELFDV